MIPSIQCAITDIAIQWIFHLVDQFNNEIPKNKHSKNIGKITVKDFKKKIYKQDRVIVD